MPPDIGRADVQIAAEKNGDVTAAERAVLGNEIKRHAHIRLHLVLQRLQNPVQLFGLEGTAGLFGLVGSQTGKLESKPDQLSVQETKAVPLPPRLMPGDDGLADVIQAVQATEGIGGVVKIIPVLCPFADLLQTELCPGLDDQPLNGIHPILVRPVPVRVLGKQPVAISELFHSTSADNAGAHRPH